MYVASLCIAWSGCLVGELLADGQQHQHVVTIDHTHCVEVTEYVGTRYPTLHTWVQLYSSIGMLLKLITSPWPHPSPRGHCVCWQTLSDHIKVSKIVLQHHHVVAVCELSQLFILITYGYKTFRMRCSKLNLNLSPPKRPNFPRLPEGMDRRRGDRRSLWFEPGRSRAGRVLALLTHPYLDSK